MNWNLYVEELPSGKTRDLVQAITLRMEAHPDPTSGGPTPQDTFLLEWEDSKHRHFEIEIVDGSDHPFEWYFLEPDGDPESGEAGEGTMVQAVEAAGRYLPRMSRRESPR